MQIPSSFGAALLKTRLAANLSQEVLADKAGLDRSYMSLLERGKRQPSVKVLFQLADALGVSPASFLSAIEEDCPLNDEKISTMRES